MIDINLHQSPALLFKEIYQGKFTFQVIVQPLRAYR